MQQLACNLINHGYWFYHTGKVPAHKEVDVVDQKLSQLYETALDKFQRARRKRKGLANVAYLRIGRDFVLICTEGEHKLREDHPLHDIRKEPIRLHGYSIGCGKGSDGRYHASVRIGDDAFRALASYYVDVAYRRSTTELAAELKSVPFVPYARVRRQMLKLVRLINERRQPCGLEPLDYSVLKLRRSIVRVFANQLDEKAAPINNQLATA